MPKEQKERVEHLRRLDLARKRVDACVVRNWGVFDDLAMLACAQLALDGCLKRPTEEQISEAVRRAWEDAANPRQHTAINVTMKNIGELILHNPDLRRTLVEQARVFGCHVTG